MWKRKENKETNYEWKLSHSPETNGANGDNLQLQSVDRRRYLLMSADHQILGEGFFTRQSRFNAIRIACHLDALATDIIFIS